MKDVSSTNLNDLDRVTAMESLRLLIVGIPIRDEADSIIGWIEKPSLDAVKYVLAATETQTGGAEDNW